MGAGPPVASGAQPNASAAVPEAARDSQPRPTPAGRDPGALALQLKDQPAELPALAVVWAAGPWLRGVDDPDVARLATGTDRQAIGTEQLKVPMARSICVVTQAPQRIKPWAVMVKRPTCAPPDLLLVQADELCHLRRAEQFPAGVQHKPGSLQATSHRCDRSHCVCQ